jgi:hypothetical protein
MVSNTDVMIKVYCKYFIKALCLRSDVTKCDICPYYKLTEDSKNGETKSQ